MLRPAHPQVFGSVIEAAAVAGKPSVASEVLRRMRGAGVEPNVIAYTSLLSSYGATGDVEGAARVVEEMAAAGCRPNAKTYTELMSQLAAKGARRCAVLCCAVLAAWCRCSACAAAHPTPRVLPRRAQGVTRNASSTSSAW